jgi:hypothetical protein
MAFQDIMTPERKRFLVKRSPSGEIATVNGSPSMVISRRMIRSSFVAMRSDTRPEERGSYLALFSDAFGCQHVINEPISLLLSNGCAPDYTGGF